MKPGEYLLDEAGGDIEANAGRETRTVMVRHTWDRPVQVGSHFHFFEVNRAMEFDHNGLVEGSLDDEGVRQETLRRPRARGFLRSGVSGEALLKPSVPNEPTSERRSREPASSVPPSEGPPSPEGSLP